MSARPRGAQNIRTHSVVLGSGSHSNERHVHQFQLAALELERTRRNKEKVAALRRVRDIDLMLAEIEVIMRRHQEALGISGSEASAPNPEPPDTKRRVLRY
jgi:hypothetical protein